MNEPSPLFSAEENIKLAYRNLKKSSGSKTAGTDKKTIKDIAKLSEKEIIEKAVEIGMEALGI